MPVRRVASPADGNQRVLTRANGAVVARVATKSMLAAKSFSTVYTLEALLHFSRLNCLELHGRLIREYERNKRVAKSLVRAAATVIRSDDSTRLDWTDWACHIATVDWNHVTLQVQEQGACDASQLEERRCVDPGGRTAASFAASHDDPTVLTPLCPSLQVLDRDRRNTGFGQVDSDILPTQRSGISAINRDNHNYNPQLYFHGRPCE